MESKVTRCSAATVVALAVVLILVNPFGAKHSVVLAEIQNKQIDAIVLRGTKKFTSVEYPNIVYEFDIIKYISKEYGYTEKGYIKDELSYSITFNLPEKQTIILVPTWNKFLKFPCTDEQLKIMNKLTSEEMLDLLLQDEYEELGTSELNGITVEGFAFEDVNSLKDVFPKKICNIEKCKGAAWIEIKKLLPVRIEADMVIGKCLFTAYTNFNLHEVNILDKYNVELDKKLFSTEVPEGYTELKLTDILPFIPVKVKAAAAGMGILPIGLVFYK